MLRVKQDSKHLTVERMIVGFGFKRFKLADMESEEVAKWNKRGAKLEEYFDEVKGERKGQDGETATAIDAAKKRYHGRIDVLIGMSFSRTGDSFVHVSGKSITAKLVNESTDEDFAGFLSAPAAEEKVEGECDAKVSEPELEVEAEVKTAVSETAKTTKAKTAGK